MTTTAYMPSPAPAQSGADYRPRLAPAHLKETEITRPNMLATRMNVYADSTLACYGSLTNASTFRQYYNEQLHAYLTMVEQKLVEKSGMHGRYPVTMARIGELVVMLSANVLAAAGWVNPSPPNLTEVFQPLTEVKQFCGEWKVGGYSSNSAPPQDSATPYEDDDSNPPAPQYGRAVQMEGPCNLTFYQFKKEQTAAFDQAFQQIIDNWPDVARQQKGPSIGAARVADVLYVTTNAEDTKILDEEIDDVLSPFLNPVVVELYPYPRKPRY